MTPWGGPIAILCGPGGNGGDGWVAARLLHRLGRKLRIFADRMPKAANGGPSRHDPLHRRNRLEGRAPRALDLAHMALVIDALYGAGLTRPLEGADTVAVQSINAGGVPVLAVDCPSGLCADSGQPLGKVVEARRTITFFRRKPGHLLWPAAAFAGRSPWRRSALMRRIWRNRPCCSTTARRCSLPRSRCRSGHA